MESSYCKTTLPACNRCNSILLGRLESYIKKLFEINLDLSYFSYTEQSIIIFWIEFILYKLQYLELRRKFLKFNGEFYVKALRDIPVGIMQNMDMSPSKVYSLFRNSFKTLSVKDKSDKFNSLIIFITEKKEFNFAHKVNNFLYIEIPQCSIALFYHINKIFTNKKDSSELAWKIISNFIYTK